MKKTWKSTRIGTAVAVCTILACGLLYLDSPRGKTANASSVPDLLSALPAGAPSLVYIDLAAVRASSFYQHRPDKGPITIPNQDYADFVHSTGFDFEKDLDRIAVASWPAPSGKQERKNVVIAEGRFDRAKIHDYAARMGKLEHQQGHEVFVFPTGDGKGSNSFTFVDDHRVAFVAGPSVAILFPGSSDPSAGDPARERATRLDGAAAFMISQVPPIPNNAGAAAGGAQGAATEQLLSLARSIRWVTLAARPEADNLRISLEGECDNETSARQIQSMLEVLRMFGRAGLESSKNKQSMDPATLNLVETMLNSAAVTQAGERVRILLELTPDIFKLSAPNLPSGTALRSSKP
jgi:hypothetical protein